MNAVTPEVTISERVGQYVRLRDKIKEIKDRHKAELAPFNETLDQLGEMILAHLNQTKSDGIKSQFGTAYTIEKRSATVADAAAFRRHVIGTQAFDLIDFRVNAPAVADFVATHGGNPPPGVNYTTHLEVGVRRPTTSKKDSSE